MCMVDIKRRSFVVAYYLFEVHYYKSSPTRIVELAVVVDALQYYDIFLSKKPTGVETKDPKKKKDRGLLLRLVRLN